MIPKKENKIKEFFQPEERNWMHKDDHYTLYNGDLTDNHYFLDIQPKIGNHIEITFRNVSNANPDSALQISITKYEAGSGRIKDVNTSFSLPVEMLESFFKALQTDRSFEHELKKKLIK